MFKIFVTKDKEHEKKIRDALKKKDGYCPCKLGKLKENKCMCEEFVNQNTTGYCHCGLYYKAEE